VSPLRQLTEMTRAAIVERMIAGFRQRFGLIAEELQDLDLTEARRLVTEKYGTPAWTADLP
jgi:lipoate-protein ligase A